MSPLIHIVRGLGQLLVSMGFDDRESNELFNACASWLEKHEKKR